MDKVERYLAKYSYSIWIDLAFVILLVIITSVMICYTIFDFEKVADSFFGALLIDLLLLCFTLFLLKSFLRDFVLIRSIRKDLIIKETIDMQGECTKVNVISKMQARTYIICALELVLKSNIDNIKVVVLMNKEYFGGDIKIQKLKESLITQKYNFKSLKHSKVVLKGDKIIIDKIKECAKVY